MKLNSKSITLISLILLGKTLLGLINSDFFLIDFFSHFPIHYLFASGILAIILVLQKKSNPVGVASLLLSASINSYIIAPFYLHPPTPDPIKMAGNEKLAHKNGGLKIFSANVQYGNSDKSALIEYVKANEPDIILLQEVNDSWALALADLNNQWPYSQVITHDTGFGLAVFSKTPFQNYEIQREPILETPLALFQILVDGEILNIANIHPFSPVSPVAIKSRNNYYELLKSRLKNLVTPIIVCGDFNATPWSPKIKSLQETAHVGVVQGFGISSTWPTQFGSAGIFLDYCLTSPDVHITQFNKGPPLGSDHYPINASIRITKKININ